MVCWFVGVLLVVGCWLGRVSDIVLIERVFGIRCQATLERTPSHDPALCIVTQAEAELEGIAAWNGCPDYLVTRVYRSRRWQPCLIRVYVPLNYNVLFLTIYPPVYLLNCFPAQQFEGSKFRELES